MGSLKVVMAAVVTIGLGMSLPIGVSSLTGPAKSAHENAQHHAREATHADENYLRTAMADMAHARALAQAELAAQRERGKQLYANCVACHLSQGEGQYLLKAPALAAQEEWYILSQLKKFKSGIRGAHPEDIEGMMMAPMTALMQTEAQMHDVARYLSSLPFPPSSLVLSGDAEKGKASYVTCAVCHGDKGQGNAALKGPALAGQADWYV
ncbi:MAG: c-type cytochrome, partial [Verrucomicrobia bacterium]|nr:c-type cytochrome [Verrucomicrobiota bacterium]